MNKSDLSSDQLKELEEYYRERSAEKVEFTEECIELQFVSLTPVRDSLGGSIDSFNVIESGFRETYDEALLDLNAEKAFKKWMEEHPVEYAELPF